MSGTLHVSGVSADLLLLLWRQINLWLGLWMRQPRRRGTKITRRLSFSSDNFSLFPLTSYVSQDEWGKVGFFLKAKTKAQWDELTTRWDADMESELDVSITQESRPRSDRLNYGTQISSKYEQPHGDLQPSDLCTLIPRTSLICLVLLNVPGSAALKRLIFLYLSRSRVTAAVAEWQRRRWWMAGEMWEERPGGLRAGRRLGTPWGRRRGRERGAAARRWRCGAWRSRPAGRGQRLLEPAAQPGPALPAPASWRELLLKQTNQAPPSPPHSQRGLFPPHSSGSGAAYGRPSSSPRRPGKNACGNASCPRASWSAGKGGAPAGCHRLAQDLWHRGRAAEGVRGLRSS